MPTSRTVFALVLASAAAVLPATARRANAQEAPDAGGPSAEDALKERLEGVFVPAPGVPNQATLEAGVDRAVNALFLLIRPLARSRILDGNPLFSSITVQFRGHTIEVLSPPVSARSPDDGSISSMTGLDHNRNNVTHRLGRDALVQTCWNDAGRRVTRFVPSADGQTLTVSVEVTAPQLPVPIRYSLTYRRR